MLDPYPLSSFAADHSARAAAEAGNKAEQADRHYRELEARLDRLILITEAMWSLLKEKTSVSETDLLSRVCDLELQRDNAKATQCSACGRPLPPRRHRCAYCGRTDSSTSVFGTL